MGIEIAVASAMGVVAAIYPMSKQPLEFWLSYEPTRTKGTLATIGLILAVNAALVAWLLGTVVGSSPLSDPVANGIFFGILATVSLEVDVKAFGMGSVRHVTMPGGAAIGVAIKSIDSAVRREAMAEVEQIHPKCLQELARQIYWAHVKDLGEPVAGEYYETMTSWGPMIWCSQEPLARKGLGVLRGCVYEVVVTHRVLRSVVRRAGSSHPPASDVWPAVERRSRQIVDLRDETPELRVSERRGSIDNVVCQDHR